MNKLFFIALISSLAMTGSAFAQNLGNLSKEKSPQHLLPASEFLKFLQTDHSNLQSNERTQVGNRAGIAPESNSLWWGGYGGYGNYGWGSYYPSYYYPYYGYSSYYYPYYGYGYGWYLNDQNGGERSARTAVNHSLGETDKSLMSKTPVVCFSSDSQGTWYASADVASNVLATQQATNSECLESGEGCTQDLGCALAFGDK